LSSRWIIGGDIGQAQDPAVNAILEATAAGLDLAHLERLLLGTPYPAVAERLGALYRAAPSPCDLVIDVTGVGRAVLDLLRQAGISPVAVSIIGRGVERLEPADGIWRVPKARLMSPLACAIEGARFSIAPDLPERETFKAELAAFHRKLNQRGYAVLGGKLEHDDTVIAVALAVWWAERVNGRPQSVAGSIGQSCENVSGAENSDSAGI
jgi:hypothetical protein